MWGSSIYYQPSWSYFRPWRPGFNISFGWGYPSVYSAWDYSPGWGYNSVWNNPWYYSNPYYGYGNTCGMYNGYGNYGYGGYGGWGGHGGHGYNNGYYDGYNNGYQYANNNTYAPHGSHSSPSGADGLRLPPAAYTNPADPSDNGGGKWEPTTNPNNGSISNTNNGYSGSAASPGRNYQPPSTVIDSPSKPTNSQIRGESGNINYQPSNIEKPNGVRPNTNPKGEMNNGSGQNSIQERPSNNNDRPIYQERPSKENDRPSYQERPTNQERPQYQDKPSRSNSRDEMKAPKSEKGSKENSNKTEKESKSSKHSGWRNSNNDSFSPSMNFPSNDNFERSKNNNNNNHNNNNNNGNSNHRSNGGGGNVNRPR